MRSPETNPELPTSAQNRSLELGHLLEGAVPELEDALGPIGFPFRPSRPDHRLRIRGACGIASEAVKNYLRAEGEQVVTIFRRLDSCEHVMNRVDGYDEPIVVDASYSQFFWDYGMTTWQERRQPGLKYFPEQRVIVFPQSRLSDVAEWAADVTQMFWRRCQGQPDGPNPWNPSFEYAVSRSELVERFTDIWDISAYESWEHPVDYVVKDGADLAARLSSGNYVS